MTTHSHHHSRRRLDGAGLSLLVTGVVFGIIAYWLVTARGLNPLLLVPSACAATTGAAHLTKREVRS